jgi:DNA polymerase I-like protein with 3'-5' exonuclease and polymerase domains
VITTVEEFLESLDYLKLTAKEIGFDLETTGTNAIDDKVIGIAYGTTEKSYYLPLREWKNDALAVLLEDEPAVVQELCEVLLQRQNLVMQIGRAHV